MLINNKVLLDPLKETSLPPFATKLGVNHYSATQFTLPDAAWLFKYVVLTQEQRRALFESNSAMEAGKRVGDALQRTYAETIWKLNPLTKKIAPAKNEKITLDNAIQEQIELFKEYEPVDDKDSDKKIKYLDEVPNIIHHANDALTKLGVADFSVTSERQISIPNNGSEEFFSFMAFPYLPIVGRIDFDFSKSNVFGANPTEVSAVASPAAGSISDPDYFSSAFPHKIIELKTKYSRLGKIRKDGSRSFTICPPPATPSFNHVVQCAVYAAYYNFKVPVYLVYATDVGYSIFDSINCKHLTVDGMKKNLQIMNYTFMRREKILSQYQHLERDEIIENAIQMIDPNFDHPWCWQGLPEELLQQAKELWRVS